MSEAPCPSAEALALLDDAPCGLMQTASDGTFLRANRLFCSWVGHTSENLVGRRRFQDLLTMGGRIFHQTHWVPLLQMQGSVSEVKLELEHHDGGVIPMVLNAIRRERGKVVVHDLAAYVARDRDKYERELVVSRKRLETLVAEATRLQAESKDRALFAEQMMGIVSHDLRNPMSAIQMGALLLGRSALSTSQERILSKITRATSRANHLIRDLLDFTQARLGKGISISPEAMNLHEVITEALEELALAYPARPLKHERSGDGACVADGHRISQMVGNLVSNAMAYGLPEAPVTVRSSVEGDVSSVSVHNRGVAIPLEAQGRLFEPMVRGSHATSSGRSVGLGLFIVGEIARAHGGKATVVSNDEEGTTFRVAFPRHLPLPTR